MPPGAILRVELSAPVVIERLKPGAELDGSLVRPIYVYDRAVIPAGSHVHAVVDKIQKEKEAQKKGLLERVDTVASLGMNRHNLYQVSLRSASIKVPSGEELGLDLRFIRGGEEVRLQTGNDGQMKVGSSTGSGLAQHAPVVGQVSQIKHDKKRVQEFRHPVATMEVEKPARIELPGQPEPARAVAAGQPVVIPEGTKAHFLLMTELRASDNKEGDQFKARLVEPIFQADGRLVLPEGAMLDGHISKLVPPRRMSRAASIYLVFDRLTTPEGEGQKVAASLASADVGKKVPVNMDPEGGLHGNGGAKNVAKRLVVGAVTEHAVDEAVEMAVHAVAPYAGGFMGVAVLLGGHGNDVDLPQYSDLQVVFGRPVTVPQAQQQPVAPTQ